MISDHYQDKWNPGNPYPYNPFHPSPTTAPSKTDLTNFIINPKITRSEFDALKKEVEEMKQLLIKAKIYDEKNNEPNCEMENKIEFLKQVAAFVGVSLEDVFSTKNEQTPNT
jgi:hypothetical protein